MSHAIGLAPEDSLYLPFRMAGKGRKLWSLASEPQ